MANFLDGTQLVKFKLQYDVGIRLIWAFMIAAVAMIQGPDCNLYIYI